VRFIWETGSMTVWVNCRGTVEPDQCNNPFQDEDRGSIIRGIRKTADLCVIESNIEGRKMRKL